MIKPLIFGSALSAVFLLGNVSRVHYSGIQVQTPIGSAVKVTPDPSNIWSFHEACTITRNGRHSIDVLIDFDQNGQMDTELDRVRVMITDFQTDSRGGVEPFEIRLRDDAGIRWNGHANLRTPLVLPVGSGLHVEFMTRGSLGVGATVYINMIGRLVTM